MLSRIGSNSIRDVVGNKVCIVIGVMLLALGINACLRESENCHKILVFSNNGSDTIYFATSLVFPDTSIIRGVHNPLLPNDLRMCWGIE